MVCHTEDHIETMNTESSVLYYDEMRGQDINQKCTLLKFASFVSLKKCKCTRDAYSLEMQTFVCELTCL